MPIYEYHCRACNHRFAHLHPRLNEAPPPCPECGAKQPQKLFSVFNAGASRDPAPSCSLGKCPAQGACRSGTCPLD